MLGWIDILGQVTHKPLYKLASSAYSLVSSLRLVF